MTWQLAINLIATGPTLAEGMQMIRQGESLNLDPEMKTCRDCGIEMSVDHFQVAAWLKDGSPCYRPNCLPCRRKQESMLRKISYRLRKERNL